MDRRRRPRELIGPDDPHPEVDDERLRLLLREVFSAAGGTHDDWDAYDRTMRDERRTAVLVTPTRLLEPRLTGHADVGLTGGRGRRGRGPR